MTTYLTDSWSTVSGLASVAYGSPDRYADVANQVRSGSVFSFLGNSLPSDIIGSHLSYEDFRSVLLKEVDKQEGFSDYLQVSGTDLDSVANNMYSKLVQSFNEFSTYETSLSDLIEYSLSEFGVDVERVRTELEKQIPDLDLYVRTSVNLPTNKLDKLPAGSQIELNDSFPLDLDHNGVSFPTGYLNPVDYFGDIAYPGLGSDINRLPNTLVKSITEGYKGYATLQPLEDLLRSGISTIISKADLNRLSNPSRIISGLATVDTAKDLSGLGNLSSADQFMYDVDLAEIVVGLNGYTTYKPETDSNGSFIDQRLIPDYESMNADSGLTYSTRTRSLPFES